jgi:hypothetical protein
MTITNFCLPTNRSAGTKMNQKPNIVPVSSGEAGQQFQLCPQRDLGDLCG